MIHTKASEVLKISKVNRQNAEGNKNVVCKQNGELIQIHKTKRKVCDYTLASYSTLAFVGSGSKQSTSSPTECSNLMPLLAILREIKSQQILRKLSRLPRGNRLRGWCRKVMILASQKCWTIRLSLEHMWYYCTFPWERVVEKYQK